MKVILLRDVAKIGRKSELKEVPSGYALNFLIPQKLALPATAENQKRLHNELAKKHATEAHSVAQFTQALELIQAREFTYPVDANEKGHLYKGIRADDIVQFLKGENISLLISEVTLREPIKEVGTYAVELTHGTIHGVCRINVVKK